MPEPVYCLRIFPLLLLLLCFVFLATIQFKVFTSLNAPNHYCVWCSITTTTTAATMPVHVSYERILCIYFTTFYEHDHV